MEKKMGKISEEREVSSRGERGKKKKNYSNKTRVKGGGGDDLISELIVRLGVRMGESEQG